MSIAILWESVFRSQYIRLSFDLIKGKTLVTPQTFLSKASLILKALLGSQHIKDDLPNGTWHTGFIMIDKAEPAELTEL